MVDETLYDAIEPRWIGRFQTIRLRDLGGCHLDQIIHLLQTENLAGGRILHEATLTGCVIWSHGMPPEPIFVRSVCGHWLRELQSEAASRARDGNAAQKGQVAENNQHIPILKN